MYKDEIAQQFEFIVTVNEKLHSMNSDWYVQEDSDLNRFAIFNCDGDFIRCIAPLPTASDTAMMIRQCELVAGEYYRHGIDAGRRELAAQFRNLLNVAEVPKDTH
jgi:hypothetical protein